MSPDLDSRLERLKTELDDHSRIARYLDLDFERPIRSLGDGYPEYTVSLVGKFTERILKQLWRYHDVAGDPAGKALSELIKGCAPYIRSSTVLDALRDIQRLRNRSAHDGYVVAEEDGLTAVRRLLDVLVWFTSTSSEVLTGDVPRLTSLVAHKAEFLSGLYVTMGFSSVKRFELSQRTVYQLFSRQVGLRSEYVELMLSRDVEEVRQVLAATDGELLQTRLPKLTRFLVVEESGAQTPEFEDYRVVTYDRFMETIVDVDAHLVAVVEAHPALADLPARLPIPADLLSADDRTGEMSVTQIGDALTMLDELAASGGNGLVVGRSGSGKSTLLKQVVTAGREAAVHRYRFYFDMSLKQRQESFAEFVTRMLAPIMRVETSRVVDVFHYCARAGSVLCALDAIDEAVPEHTQAGFLQVFTELAEILSAESAVVMGSRTSFLEDSPQVRRLLDGTTLMSEKLVQQLHAEGVDPLKIPQFSAIRLHNIIPTSTVSPVGEVSPLELRLSTALDTHGPFADLLMTHLKRVTVQAGLAEMMPEIVAYFGAAALRGQFTFALIDVWNALGIECFQGSRLSYAVFKMRPLFRAVAEDQIAFVHGAYQELLAAEYLRDPAVRETGRGITEQIRAFLHHRSGGAAATDDCVLAPGVYVVGPSHHVMLRHVQTPVRFDRYAVTVAGYNEFLAAVRARTDPPGGTTPKSRRMPATNRGRTDCASPTTTPIRPTTITLRSASTGGARMPLPASRASGCPPPWSGRQPPAAPMGDCFPGVMTSIWRRSTAPTPGAAGPWSTTRRG